MFKIAIINESTTYTLPDAVVTALQTQVSRDFAPEWGSDATLRMITKPSDKADGEWLLAVLDDSDQADALGYHETASDGMPLGKVFAKTTTEAGLNVTVTISHELLEMIADPDINRSCEVEDTAQGEPSRFFSLEVCDSCEDDSFAYEIDGVKVSDFVRRHWFISGAAGSFDFQKKITSPLQLLSGGYIGSLDVASSGWTQLQAEESPTAPNIRSLGRLAKRNKPRSEWRRSEIRSGR